MASPSYGPFALDRAPTPGRNEPCWCGSGRKFKQCHQGAVARPPLADRVPWLARKAVDWLQHGPLEERSGLFDAAAALAVDSDDPVAFEVALADPIVLDTVLAEGGGFSGFLVHRSALLPDDERSLATSWIDARRAVYEVHVVEPGVGLTIADRAKPSVWDVRAPTLSRHVTVGTLVCGRVASDGTTNQFVGPVFPVAAADEADLSAVLATSSAAAVCEWVRDHPAG